MPHRMLIKKIKPDWHVLRVLGQGGEGIVYLVADDHTDHQYAVKLLYSPYPKTCCRGVRAYANCITGEFPGLPAIELFENEESILGAVCEYTPLYGIHHRIINSVEQIALTLFGSYCRMQAHLISAGGVILVDPYAHNFLLAADGRFHWVDFGYGIGLTDGPLGCECGLFGYGMVKLLLSIYDVDIRASLAPSPGYNHAVPCRYCMDRRLDMLALKHGWLGEVLEKVRHQPASSFTEPDFYRRLAARLPERVAMPQTVLLASSVLLQGSHAWMRLRHAARGK